MSTKKNKYHISIDSIGCMLSGTPENPSRNVSRQPVFGNRFASGDRDYTDFSIWWYWAQTDWSGGFKDQKQWEDDAKFYYSVNVDTWSEIGAVKLLNDWESVNNFTENILKTTVLQKSLPHKIRHFALKAAWKKLEPFWDLVVRLKSVSTFTPVLETVLSGFLQSDSGEKEPPIKQSAVGSRQSVQPLASLIAKPE